MLAIHKEFIMIKGFHVDYMFRFGKYNNMHEVLDSTDNLYKVNALMNILKMRPGILQDTPGCGIDTDNLLFAEEGDDFAASIGRIQDAVKIQSSLYIGSNFLDTTELDMSNDSNAQDGGKHVDFSLKLKDTTNINLEGEYNKSKGFIFNNVKKLDSTPFTSIIE
jgi:hypothetical protein